jgi:hypothetical protein
MGVLVHHSFPDEEELANGVATPQFAFGNPRRLGGDMVTQLGAVSVTNPDGASLPEVVGISREFYSEETQAAGLALKQRSSLAPLGAYVMAWEADYRNFIKLFAAVGDGFKQLHPDKDGFFLDFEYKKDANLGLVIKQVREVPLPGATNETIPFLINEPVPFTIRQGGPDIIAIHQLKSRWTLHTANVRLYETNLARGIYTHGTLEYVDDGVIRTLTGPLNTWPNASTSPSGAANYWTTGTGTSQRAWRLETPLVTSVTNQPPIFTQHDFRRFVTVNYPAPVPDLAGGRTQLTVELDPPSLAATGVGQRLSRTFTPSNGVTIETSYYLQSTPEDVAFLSPPLLRFVETRITGLTTTPIVLTNFYSQSFGSYQHGSNEEFIFEPRLEPGLPATTLAELDAANIQMLWISSFGGDPEAFRSLGREQVWRVW